MNLLVTESARWLTVCILGAVLLLPASMALGGQSGQSQTLDPRVAGDLLDAYEKIEDGEYEDGLRLLNRLMERRGENMKDFDRASVLQIRGTAHINLENVEPAMRDFRDALRLNALPEQQQNQLRLNLAQLYFVSERWEESLELFEEWMAQDDVRIEHTTWFMLAAAHYQLEDYREALEPIDQAIARAPGPERRYYDLKNAALSNLEMVPERTELMAEMVELWPDRLEYWRQLASLYLQKDEEFNSFATIEAAYINGLIESEDDIILLAQYYSTFNNPYRGAQLLEREMEAGNVSDSVEHLEMLSQLWSQAREHRKAIPVLREAAAASETGTLYFRLGQALMADERHEDAERAFANALDTGGMDDERTADAWLMLGNARFDQAGPGDRAQRTLADEAFERAERYQRTRVQASEWRGYIRAINETETRQAMLEQEQQERLAEAAEERAITACRAQQLAGRDISEECERLLRQEEEVEPLPEEAGE